ncbi:MAG: CopD family protein [Alphaproteobacteria bacterium]|nr:CopD family protein [Alphaproteobacteria bacterium]
MVGDTVAIATIALILHIFSAVVWVGGMFFALIVLRPATGALEPGPRLGLWLRVFERFFAWVFAAIALLLASGYAMVFWVFAGFRGIGLHVNIMQATGILMMLLFFHLYFAPWRRYRAALARQDQAAAAAQLGQIRAIVAINLLLGLVTVAVGSSGRYWG